MKKALLAICLTLFTWTHAPDARAQAGGSGGNGGDAVLTTTDMDHFMDLAFRLLDFYQIDLADPKDKIAELVATQVGNPTREQLRLQRDLDIPLAELPVDRLFQKRILTVLGTLDPLLARIIAAPFAIYHWERLDDVDFIDDFKSSADYREDRVKPYLDELWKMQFGVHQVGRRILDQVQISNKVFNKMYYFDQTGLFFHEAIYALLKKDETHRYGQQPEQARLANRNLFQNLVQTGAAGSPFDLGQMSFASVLTDARALYQADENLKVTYERGKFYRITGKKFEIEFKFEPYKTSFFDTYFLKPSLKKL